MKSIYDMMGRYTYPILREDAPIEHVEKFFQVGGRRAREEGARLAEGGPSRVHHTWPPNQKALAMMPSPVTSGGIWNRWTM